MIRNYVDRSLHHSEEPDAIIPVWLVILALCSTALGCWVGSLLG